MKHALDADLALALAMSLERSQGDLVKALAMLREARSSSPCGAAHLVARAINRLEMMRMALGHHDDGPSLT